MRRLFATAATAILLASCSGTATGPMPAASGTAQAAMPTAAVAVSASLRATLTPTLAPTPTPRVTPEPTPALRMTKSERALVRELRTDARVDCRPRRANLPWGSSAGVECFVNSDLVRRVGVYAFRDQQALEDFESEAALAATHYFVTLAAYDVDAHSGDCHNGVPGDASWPDYLPDEGDGPHGLSSWRLGCYHDEYGQANIRVTCYGGVYIGILGKTDDIKALAEWAWKAPEDQSTERDPPGICEYAD